MIVNSGRNSEAGAGLLAIPEPEESVIRVPNILLPSGRFPFPCRNTLGFTSGALATVQNSSFIISKSEALGDPAAVIAAIFAATSAGLWSFYLTLAYMQSGGAAMTDQPNASVQLQADATVSSNISTLLVSMGITSGVPGEVTTWQGELLFTRNDNRFILTVDANAGRTSFYHVCLTANRLL